MSSTVVTANDIRPFHVDVPQEELDDLRRRIGATNWPEKETVPDESQGVPLAMIQKLARYWMTDYDWRTCEAKLNALPQFLTEIDGLDIHFHSRSVEARGRVAADRQSRMAGLDHRAAEDHRSTDRSNGIRRERNRRLRRRDSVDAGLRVLGQVAEHRLGPRAAGRSGPTPTSSTSTRSTGAATSPPGKSPSCSRPRSGRRSARCANDSPHLGLTALQSSTQVVQHVADRRTDRYRSGLRKPQAIGQAIGPFRRLRCQRVRRRGPVLLDLAAKRVDVLLRAVSLRPPRRVLIHPGLVIAHEHRAILARLQPSAP